VDFKFNKMAKYHDKVKEEIEKLNKKLKLDTTNDL
jgi:hypothetical protein